MAIELIDTIKPKNNGSFPIVEAEDVLMPDGKRLNEYQFTPGTEGREEITVTVDVLPEQTLSFANARHTVYAYYDISGYSKLTVVWDGVEHTLAPIHEEFGSLIGNLSLAEAGADTGEPFLFVTAPGETAGNETGMTQITANDDATSHTVRIYQTTTTVIETSSAVPKVSAADNGKIYQVVDGKMAAVPLGDSAVKTYIDDYISEALGGDY